MSALSLFRYTRAYVVLSLILNLIPLSRVLYLLTRSNSHHEILFNLNPLDPTSGRKSQPLTSLTVFQACVGSFPLGFVFFSLCTLLIYPIKRNTPPTLVCVYFYFFLFLSSLLSFNYYLDIYLVIRI